MPEAKEFVIECVEMHSFDYMPNTPYGVRAKLYADFQRSVPLGYRLEVTGNPLFDIGEHNGTYLEMKDKYKEVVRAALMI